MNIPKEIDIAKVIQDKSGKMLPVWVARLLQRLIHEDEINGILYRHGTKEGRDFLEALMADLQVEVSWLNPEALPESGRYFFVSNHALGAWDGIGISRLLSERYGDVRYMVNDMLYNLKPLRSIFLPVNTYGAQRREAVEEIGRIAASDIPLASFPAGYCSRKIRGRVQDTAWHKSFINLAITHKRDIVPLHFVGQNSRHFYLIDRVRKALGIKFDLATALLPDEMFRAKGKKFWVIVGQPIPYQELIGKNARGEAERIRQISYDLSIQFAEALKEI